jgi:hypothetical protein
MRKAGRVERYPVSSFHRGAAGVLSAAGDHNVNGR